MLPQPGGQPACSFRRQQQGNIFAQGLGLCYIVWQTKANLKNHHAICTLATIVLFAFKKVPAWYLAWFDFSVLPHTEVFRPSIQGKLPVKNTYGETEYYSDWCFSRRI